MAAKKIEDIELGQRIKDIRAGLKMNQKSFSKKIGATVSALSNWENGRNKPNDIMLREIAQLGNVSVNYLLNGEENITTKKLIKQIESLKVSIENKNKKIANFEKAIDDITDKLNNLFLDEPSSSVNHISQASYKYELESLEKMKEAQVRNRELLVEELDNAEKILEGIRKGNIFSIKDRQNPEFEAHNIDQKKISEYLQGIPYHLNYESTMEVFEHAKELMKKEENRFNP